VQTLAFACVVVAAVGAAAAGGNRLECGGLTLEFADEAAGTGLSRLASHGQPLVASPDPKPLLWRIELRSEDKALKPLVLDNRVAAKASATASKEGLALRWDQIALPDEPSIMAVEVRIARKGDAATEWSIEVECCSKRYGVWDVFFPVMANVGGEARPDVAVSRGNWGMLYREGKDRQTGSYPSYQWPMQFLCVNRGESGLYLACHDTQAWPKRFSLTPQGEFHFLTHAPERGVEGNGYRPRWPVVVGAYRGDWWQGAKLYRTWALAEAPWTKKGPVSARKDVPKALTGLGLWMLGGGHAKEVVPKMHEAAKLFEVPIGIHWYNWHEIPFDTYYPNYFPAKPGFAEGVKELVSKGMVVMPYINGRLWDSGNENFKEAFPFACKTPEGKPYLEQYAKDGRMLACMCPATPFWQKKVQEICQRLLAECGVNAIHIDQIAAAAPQLCHDKSHGHPIGGGAHWVEGYRTMLVPIMQAAHADGRDVIITTENDAEPYMDNLNAFLIWNPRYDNEIPMMSAVYSGHSIYFSSPSAVNDELRAFCASQGRDWLWGCQLGWMGFELLAPANRAKAEYLRELCKQRLAAAKFMVHGELLGEVKPLNDVPKIELTWNRERAHKAVLPAAMATLWRAPDGQLAVAMTNWDDSEHAFRYRLKEGEEHTEPLKARQVIVRTFAAKP